MTPSFFRSAALLVALALPACKKDKSETATPAVSTTDKLTTSDWHTTAYTISNSTGTHDIWITTATCDKDDRLQFKADHSLLSKYGANRCSATQTDKTGTWALSANDAKLTFTYPGVAPLTYEVVSLTTTELHLRTTLTAGGTTSTFDLTMMH